MLALAGSFRERGLISRVDLVKSAFWQVLFVLRGASAERVRSAAEDGMKILNGFSVADMQHLVGDAMETVLRPLVYAEPLRLVEQHRARGERVYIVSATLQEIVQHIADDLGFDGAIGSTCEIVDGVYTGRRCAPRTARARRARCGSSRRRRARPRASTAYSDSYSDVPFLEAVGHPVAANPDRSCAGSRASAGWPVVDFCGVRLTRRARGSRRSASAPTTSRRSRRTSSTPSARGQLGHGLSRIEWLETWDDLPPDARRGASTRSRGTSAGTATARSAT